MYLCGEYSFLSFLAYLRIASNMSFRGIEKSFYHFFIHSLSILIIGIHMPFGEESKKVIKKLLSLIFDGQNKFQPFNILNHLLRKQ